MCRHLFLFFFLFISFALIWFAVAVLLRALIISKFQALAGCCCCRGNGRRVKKFVCVIHVFGKCLLWDSPIYFIHKIMAENTKSGLWWNERIAEIKIKAEERKKNKRKHTHTSQNKHSERTVETQFGCVLCHWYRLFGLFFVRSVSVSVSLILPHSLAQHSLVCAKLQRCQEVPKQRQMGRKTTETPNKSTYDLAWNYYDFFVC